jgi:hypothetical protein
VPADSEDGTPGVSDESSILFEPFTADELTSYAGRADAAGGVFETVASVRVFGRTTGGMDVDTPEYFFPIRIYSQPYGCFCEVPEDSPETSGCPDLYPYNLLCP